jgi:tetratricopeptide (TPR) repeat protein
MLLLAYISFFSMRQWRAENSYPVQKSLLNEYREDGIPDEEQAGRIKRSISLSPDIAEYHVFLGKHYAYGAAVSHKDGTARLVEAEKEYSKALFLNPSYTEVLSYLAWARFSRGRPFEALRLLESALRLEPANYFNHLYYGICVSEFLDALPESLRKIYLYRANEEFRKGLELNPKMALHPSVQTGRARLYLKKGDAEAAIAEIEKFRAVDARTLPYHVKLADLYLDSGREGKAVSKYKALLESPNIDSRGRRAVVSSLIDNARKHPGSADLKLVLGEVYFEEGALENALETLQELASLRPASAEAHYLLGEVYESMGDEEAANREYLKTLQYSGDHRGASVKIRDYYKQTLGTGMKDK